MVEAVICRIFRDRVQVGRLVHVQRLLTCRRVVIAPRDSHSRSGASNLSQGGDNKYQPNRRAVDTFVAFVVVMPSCPSAAASRVEHILRLLLGGHHPASTTRGPREIQAGDAEPGPAHGSEHEQVGRARKRR